MARGLVGIKTIRDFVLTDKVVFLRLDLNVPMEGSVEEGRRITDETRITASLPTIRYALEQGAKLVMASHLGRPKSSADRKDSLEPVAERLSELLNTEVLIFDEPKSDGVKALISGLKKGQAILLENLRFEKGETENEVEFAQVLASYSQVYINDAFGASHRAHASIEALPRLMKEKGIGFLIEKEIQMLDRLLENPQRPYFAILGGSKVSDKIGVMETLMDRVDGFIVGGAMAYTFLKAQGVAVGRSRIEADRLNFAREMILRMQARDKKILLPVDHRVAAGLDATSALVTSGVAIDEGFMGCDIGPKTEALYAEALQGAKTVFWNGPMGVFENPAFSSGTFAVAKALAKNSSAFRVVGGGDSAAAVESSGLADKMSHISTGGGASLEYLQGDQLPGLEVLRNRRALNT